MLYNTFHRDQLDGVRMRDFIDGHSAILIHSTVRSTESKDVCPGNFSTVRNVPFICLK